MSQETPSPETVFAAALERAKGGPRRAFLDQVCVGDAVLRQEVESLLTAHEAAGQFLQPTAVLPVLGVHADPTARDAKGRTPLDLASTPDDPGLRAGVAAGRKESADLLRGTHQVQTPDAKIQKSNQSTNLPAREPKP
jgi:hypothetical protein